MHGDDRPRPGDERRDAGQAVHDLLAPAPRARRQEQLLGDLAAYALPVLAGQRDELGEVAEAVGSKARGARDRGHDLKAQRRKAARQGGGQPAQVGLRAAAHARGEKEGVEHHAVGR